MEHQRVRQQGKGKPILSSYTNGIRTVAVGSSSYSSPDWITFHDFLIMFPLTFFGKRWFDEQANLERDERHPVAVWFEDGQAFAKAHMKMMGSRKTALVSGSLKGYLDFSYSLYLIQHNSSIPELVAKRLRDPMQFLGAFYEIWVAGWFIKAGFTITYEDESDSSKKHCEFIATHPETGRSFSVEAKRRQPNDVPERVGRSLKQALLKDADHTRIIAIEANLKADIESVELRQTMEGALAGIRERETRAPFATGEADPAYVLITNTPYQHHPEETVNRWAIGEGYKIPDFKYGVGYASIREMVESRDRHKEIYALLQALGDHEDIPVTFDGGIPELAFASNRSRLLIGNRYLVPTESGESIVAELVQAVVMGTEKVAHCICKTAEGKNIMMSADLTEAEYAAYQSHPDTFFGEISRNQNARDPLDLYDSFLENYSQSSKEQLLEMMKEHSDVANLRELDRAELVGVFCERTVQSIVNDGVFENKHPVSDLSVAHP